MTMLRRRTHLPADTAPAAPAPRDTGVADLLALARARRHQALLAARMPQLNIFWDGTPPRGPRDSVIAQLTDARLRLGRTRLPLTPAPV